MKPINLVALIDDDEIVTFVEEKLIESTHLVNNINSFSNGQLAIDYLEANIADPSSLPEIILLDLNMPNMDGFEFMEAFIQLKPKIGKKITIYIVSSSISNMDLDRIKNISEVTD